MTLMSLVGAIPAEGSTHSEGLISVFILSRHGGTPALEHAWSYVTVSSLAFLVRKFTLASQKIGNFLARLLADVFPSLVNTTLFNNR